MKDKCQESELAGIEDLVYPKQRMVWVQDYNDRLFRTKLGLSQSLMVQEGTHNLNVTLKGYPKKFWGLFGQKAHKTQQITPFHPKRRFILNPNEPWTDLQP